MGTLARLGSRLGQLAQAVHRRGSGDSLGVLAAGLTYYAFLSLFPLLLLGLSMLGFLLAGNPAAQAEWVTRLRRSIPGLSGLIGRNLQAIVGGRVGTGVVGLAGAAWTASSLTGATENALSRVFRTPRTGLVRRHLRALGLTSRVRSS